MTEAPSPGPQLTPRPMRCYAAITARLAWPPRLLLTVTLPGFEAVVVSSRPPEIVPRSAPVDVTYTFNVAPEPELDASTLS